MKTRLLALLFVLVMGFFAFNTKAEALSVVGCNFSRNLSVGMWGEDVRCLQSYLANSGNTTVSIDGYYGSLTSQAVARWQVGNGLAPTGSFDSASRARYAQITGYKSGGTTSVSSKESEALQSIHDALAMIQNADEEVDDSRGNNSKAKDLLKDAKTDIVNSVKAFYEGNFSKATDLAEDALDEAQEALDRVDDRGSSSNKNDVEDLIDDVDERIDDAEDEINDARRRGENVRDAEDLLDEARDTLDEAEEQFDDRDYDDAEDLAEEADELVDDALDELDDNDSGNHNTRTAALNKINDAEDAIDDAREEIEDADDDGDDVDEAEDILMDAEDTYDDAQIEFNKGNYDEAYDLAKEAIELAEDAVDAID